MVLHGVVQAREIITLEVPADSKTLKGEATGKLRKTMYNMQVLCKSLSLYIAINILIFEKH